MILSSHAKKPKNRLFPSSAVAQLLQQIHRRYALYTCVSHQKGVCSFQSVPVTSKRLWSGSRIYACILESPCISATYSPQSSLSKFKESLQELHQRLVGQRNLQLTVLQPVKLQHKPTWGANSSTDSLMKPVPRPSKPMQTTLQPSSPASLCACIQCRSVKIVSVQVLLLDLSVIETATSESACLSLSMHNKGLLLRLLTIGLQIGPQPHKTCLLFDEEGRKI